MDSVSRLRNACIGCHMRLLPRHVVMRVCLITCCIERVLSRKYCNKQKVSQLKGWAQTKSYHVGVYVEITIFESISCLRGLYKEVHVLRGFKQNEFRSKMMHDLVKLC